MPAANSIANQPARLKSGVASAPPIRTRARGVKMRTTVRITKTFAESRKNQSVCWIIQENTASNAGAAMSLNARVPSTKATMTTADTMKTLPCRSTGNPNREWVMLSCPMT